MVVQNFRVHCQRHQHSPFECPFIRYCTRQFSWAEMLSLLLKNLFIFAQCLLIDIYINLLYAHCNFVFEMQLVLVLLHVQSQHLGFRSFLCRSSANDSGSVCWSLCQKIGGWWAGSGPNGGWRNWRVAQMNNGMEQTSCKAIKHSSWSLVKAFSDMRVSYESPTVLLMFIAQKFDISGLVLIYPHPWHPWALPPSPGQGPPRPARCDMRLFICTCIDPISRSRSCCIVLDLTHPYTIFPQRARMLVSKLVGTWIFVLLWGALHGPNCPESFDGLGGGQGNT